MIGRLKLLLLNNRGTRQTVTKNTFWLTISNFGGRLLRAIIVIYAARTLGTEEWGVFSYALTVAAMLTIFVDFGVGPLLTRESSKFANDPIRRKQIISTSFYLRIVLLVISTLLVIYGTPYVTTIEAAIPLLPIMAVIMILDSTRDFFVSIARSLERMEWEAFLSILTNASVVLIGIALLQISASAEFMAYGYAFGIGVGTIATIYLLRKELSGMFTHFDFKYVRLMFTAAIPFAISAILAGIMVNTDILFIGFFRSAEEVGLYSAILRIIQMLYILPGIIATSSFPLFARLAYKDDPKLRLILEKIIGTMFLIAMPLAIGGALAAGPLTELIYGKAYLPATASFQVLLLTLIINFPMAILTNFIFAYNKQKSLIVFSTLGALSNVFLNFLFIPTFGILGSAWATFGAQAISNTYLWFVSYKINPFSIFSYLPKIIVATAGMGAITFLGIVADLPIWMVILAASAFYFLILLGLKESLVDEYRETLKLI